jgi:hypothetical protein
VVSRHISFLPYLIAAKKYDEKPRYIMFSGLVFQPLDRNLLAAHGMKNLQVRYHFDSYVSADIYKDRPEVIVLTSILPDSINSYFSNFTHSIVDEVNGVKVKTLKDVHNALAKDKGDYIVISLLGNGRPIVIERAKVEAAQKRIQKKYKMIWTVLKKKFSYLLQEVQGKWMEECVPKWQKIVIY